MSTSALYPPYDELLSDSVIGNVMQSSRLPRSSYVANNGGKVAFDTNFRSATPETNMNRCSDLTKGALKIPNNLRGNSAANSKIATKSQCERSSSTYPPNTRDNYLDGHCASYDACYNTNADRRSREIPRASPYESSEVPKEERGFDDGPRRVQSEPATDDSRP